jgi:hypothetical protein
VISYEMLTSFKKTDAALLNVNFGLLVLDEAHKAKGASQSNKACHSIKREFTLLSTGTSEQMCSVAHFVKPGTLFHNDPEDELKNYSYAARQAISLDNICNYFIRRTKLDLDENGKRLVPDIPGIIGTRM